MYVTDELWVHSLPLKAGAASAKYSTCNQADTSLQIGRDLTSAALLRTPAWSFPVAI